MITIENDLYFVEWIINPLNKYNYTVFQKCEQGMLYVREGSSEAVEPIANIVYN